MVNGDYDEAILVLANRQWLLSQATIIYSRVKLSFMMDRGRHHWGF